MSSVPAPLPRAWVGLILAAGESLRMGRPKTHLEWEGGALLTHQVTALTEAGAGRVVAVVNPADASLVVGQAVAVANPHPELGKTHSLRLGIEASPPCDAFVILAVDQPRPAPLLRRLVDAHFACGLPITIPVHQGRRGHPVVVSWNLRDEILAATEGAAGLRGIVRADPERVSPWETEDPTVLLDLNTPEDYRRARPPGS